MKDIIKYKHKDDSILNVYQANALIEATYKMSIGSKRLMLILISQIDLRKSSPIKNSYRVTAKDYGLSCNISDQAAYKQLSNAANELLSTVITIHNEKERYIRKILTSRSAIYHYGLGHIDFCFNQDIERYIWYLQKNFTQFKLMEAVKFKRFYTIRLYELLMQYDTSNNHKLKEKEKGIDNYLIITVERLQKVLGLLKEDWEGNIFLDKNNKIVFKKPTYQTFSAFNRYILKPSIKEIQEKTNLVIKASTLRTGRAITSIRFDFEREKQSDMFKK